jgi:fumarate reductase subunit C
VAIRALGHGPDAYARVLARLRTPLFVILNALALAFVLFHSITWFNLAPKAMVVRLNGKRVPDLVVAGANYAAWIVLSAAVAALLLRG